MQSEVNFLDTLTEPQQLQVSELMTITDIQDGNLAAQLYIECNYDVNRAVQRFFDHGLQGLGETRPVAEEYFPPQRTPTPNQRTENNGSQMRILYRKFIERKAREEEEKSMGESFKEGASAIGAGLRKMYNVIVPVSLRGETEGGEQFLGYFRERYPEISRQLKFNVGSFEENAEISRQIIRPLLVYMHLDGAVFKEIPNQFLSDRKLSKFIGNAFHLLGILVNTESSQKVTRYVETKNCPCLAVFRKNIFDEIVLINFATLSSDKTPAQVLEQLNHIDRSCHTLRTEEELVKREVARDLQNQRRMNFQMEYFQQEDFEGGYGGGRANPPPRQISPEEQERLEQARLLRQIQQEEYSQVERQIMEQQRKQEEEETMRKSKAEQEAREREQREEEERKIQEMKASAKKVKLEGLPTEPAENDPEAITIIFRLPDGDRTERRFRKGEKAQILYDFVDTKELVFDSSTVRYDLMQPRPFLCLDDKDKAIGEYFEDSNHEMITVRELTA